ncbi:MAG: hypothetical protein NT028_07880 [candidate division Zixibacteria bacterium]|nr:hypothetical protein [candidate division Zixibacteria bacterium]
MDSLAKAIVLAKTLGIVCCVVVNEIVINVLFFYQERFAAKKVKITIQVLCLILQRNVFTATVAVR